MKNYLLPLVQLFMSIPHFVEHIFEKTNQINLKGTITRQLIAKTNLKL